jgi:nucleoid-associated protein YgaU
MIHEGSRYATAEVFQVTTADGSVRPAVYPRRAADTGVFSFKTRRLQAGERLDMIAFREYGDASLWWVIAQANPEIFYPESLPTGALIRIPDAASIYRGDV